MRQVIKNNNETFYDYNTDKKVRRWPALSVFLIVAVVFTSLFRNDLQAFVVGVATAQSILVGFSFSVMFFLLSADVVSAPKDNSSIERQLKYKKLKKLSTELFHNVSYFNLIAITCVFLSIFLMLPKPGTEHFSYLMNGLVEKTTISSLAQAKEALLTAGTTLLIFLFYFSLIESFAAFFRTAMRVSYFFEEKIKYDAPI